MNHELLLKSEVPVNQALPIRSQVVSESPKANENKPSQTFSSELDRHIGKQEIEAQPVVKAGSEIATSGSVESGDEVKAEPILDENGNILPTEKEIAAELTHQILADFEGDVATKKELTQIIEQFVHDFVNNETPDVDLKDSISSLINQLLTAGLAVDKVQQDPKSGGLTTPDPAKVVAPLVTNVTQTLAGSTTKISGALKQAVIEGDSLQQGSAKPTFITDGDSDDGQAKQKPVSAESVKADFTKVERLQSVIQQIKDIVTNDAVVKADDNEGKTKLISSLVKQLLTTQSTDEKPIKQIVLNETAEKIAPLNLGGTKLRPDILQALTTKAGPITESNEPLTAITNSVLKNEVKLVDDKQVEKIRQLVDILKPAKSDEQFVRTVLVDKIAPAINTTFLAPTGSSVTHNVAKIDVPTLDIQPSLQSKAWNNVLSSRVVWMAREGIQQAALKLNPANLGPVEVRLNIQNEQANITFIAQNPATREALEQALPRLRESFMENGLELADADVSDHASQQAHDETNQDGEELSNGNSVGIMAESANENGQEAATKVKLDLESGLSVYA